MQLANHTFVVTGGGSGLGAACVARFAAAGARVVTIDLKLPDAAEMHNVLACTADVTQTEDVNRTLQVAIDSFGAVHGVVHCAGILTAALTLGRDGPHDLEAFRRTIEINLIGTFNVVRLTAAAMANNAPNRDGERGVIVNTASISAFEGQMGQAAYAASKGGVASMTLPLARDLARYGIRVVAIAPGVFHTPMIDAAPEKVQQSLRAQTLFPPRLGEPAEFAALVQHAIENSMLNGTTLRLDGGTRLAAK